MQKKPAGMRKEETGKTKSSNIVRLLGTAYWRQVNRRRSPCSGRSRGVGMHREAFCEALRHWDWHLCSAFLFFFRTWIWTSEFPFLHKRHWFGESQPWPWSLQSSSDMPTVFSLPQPDTSPSRGCPSSLESLTSKAFTTSHWISEKRSPCSFAWQWFSGNQNKVTLELGRCCITESPTVIHRERHSVDVEWINLKAHLV